MTKYTTIILLCFAVVAVAGCTINMSMTKEEKAIIDSGDNNTPMRVLLIANQEDSLFLRKTSEDVDTTDIKNDKDLQKLIDRLTATLHKANGVGIAAIQVGVARNLFLFLRLDEPGMPIQVAINPKITNHPDEHIVFEGDGCLSIPDKSGSSMRYAWIEVEYYDREGNLIKETLSGHSRSDDFTGIVFQHEFDHLKGVLFTDKLAE